jgi:hypothetical protein
MKALNSLSKKSSAKNQVLYRIFTQDREDYRNTIIHSLKARGIPDFTIVGPAFGYGPGQGGLPERTVVIEVAADDSLPQLRAIRGVVDDIKHKNNQQSVFVVAFPVEHCLVPSEIENQLLLPIEEISKPQRKLKGRFVKKPWIVARSGKWQMLLRVVEASMGKV